MEFRAKLQGEDIVDKPWADKVNWSMRMNAWQLKYDNTRPQPWLWNSTSHSDVPRCAKALRGITLVEARLPSGAGLYEGLQAGDIEEAILYQLPAYATRSAKISSIYRWHQLHSCVAENPTSNLPSWPAKWPSQGDFPWWSTIKTIQDQKRNEKKAETPVVHWQNSRIFVRQDHGRWPLFQLFQMKQLTLHPWHVGQGAWLNISTPLNRFCNELF